MLFSEPFQTPHGLVPFDCITADMYEPAIEQGIAQCQVEIDNITRNPEAPTFENTIVALERSGEMLNRVLGVFYPMLSANADDQLMDISQRVAPKLAEHSSSITLNHDLWLRVKAVHDSFDRESHDQEDWMLLDKTYRSFVRNGASLEGEDRNRYRELNKRLTEDTLKFEQNHLKATNAYELWLNADDLSGLPESAIEAAAHAANEKSRKGEYLFTLHAPSYMAFMKYSDRRDLREKLYMAYNTQCTSGEFDNMELCRRIANTRLELAQLMGFKTFADYRLCNSMAQTPKAVMDMLEQLRVAYAPVMRRELERLTEFAARIEGNDFELKPWDYSYYSNKERDSLYQINDELLRPYFPLNQVIDGVFGLATRLYGLHFELNRDAQVFDPEVKVYDVTNSDGQWMGALYTDFFPRNTKQSGAWMTAFREQYCDAMGNDVRPLVTLTMNFTRPTHSKPSLLTFGEVRTFLHEFGHGLHCLLSCCRYESTSGTNVYRDFVELPSQFHENFLTEREFLDSFACHYQTGEPIPQEYIDRILAASQYGAGYSCMRQLSFGLLDMAWYGIDSPFTGDIVSHERNAMQPVQAFAPINGCVMSPQFGHIFSGGYAAGYYGYKWAEILDADAFSKFQEDGIFNPDTARLWHDCVMSRGSSDMPMTLYTQFRGRPPRIDALLHRDGIKS